MEMISKEALTKLIESKAEYVLVDVRERHELSHGSLPTAHNIPLHDFIFALDLPPEEFKRKYGFALTKQSRLILYCRSGNRSAFATDIASSKGFNAANYAGSALEWSKTDKNVRAY